jgi:hypothetical protein
MTAKTAKREVKVRLKRIHSCLPSYLPWMDGYVRKSIPYYLSKNI